MSKFNAVLLFSFSIALSGEVIAENLLENVTQRAEKVGTAIEAGVESVGDTVVSTADLVTNEATQKETRSELDQMATDVINMITSENSEAAALYQISAGYAIFDTRKITIMPVTAGYGRGVAISREDGSETYMNMGTGGVGAALLGTQPAQSTGGRLS